MKERPILFNAEMVRALLSGEKTMTRRVVMPQPAVISFGWQWLKKAIRLEWGELAKPEGLLPHCPYGKPGDQLWVRETFWTDGDELIYRADPGAEKNLDSEMTGLKWKPSIFMPRWAARIQLEITDVRVERVQDILELEALAEGVFAGMGEEVPTFTARDAFYLLWDSINESRGFGWEANPWVWVVEFRLLNRAAGGD